MLYPTCRKFGMEVFEFWDYTYGELIEYINLQKEAKIQEQKERAAWVYQLALMTSIFSAKAYNGQEPPALYEIFPNLFNEDEVPKANDNSWILEKERLLDFATEHNQQVKEAKKNDS